MRGTVHGTATRFAASDAPFAMECAQRTEADKKGGHLANGKQGLLLRESAQVPCQCHASAMPVPC